MIISNTIEEIHKKNAPYSMAWSTCYFTDLYISEALSEGDAVVASSNLSTLDGHIGATLHMHSISVGTVAGVGDFEIYRFEVLAFDDTKVEVLAIEGCYAIDDSVGH